MLQNGIYFIQDFPHHYFSRLLLSIPEYTRFASFQRRQVLATVEKFQQEELTKLSVLGDNVGTVIGALQRELFETTRLLSMHKDMFQQQVLNLQQQMINLQSSFVRQNQTLQQISSNQEQISNTIVTINTRQEQIFQLIENLRSNAQNNNMTPLDQTNTNNSTNNNSVTVNVHNHTVVQPIINEDVT